jgi:hypothetical protein
MRTILKGGDHMKDLGIDERIILKCIFKKLVWTGFRWLRIGSGGGLL